MVSDAYDLGELAATNISLNGTVNDTMAAAGGAMVPEKIAKLKLANQITLTIICTSMMIGMGCAITLNDIRTILRRPWGVLIGVFCQYGILPLAAFTLAHILKLHPAHAIGMLVVSCSPGGVASNLLTYYLEGDITLSICMTTCSTFLAFGLMPLCLFIYSRQWVDHSGVPAIPYVDIIVALVTILPPVMIGMFIRRKWEKRAGIISRIGGVIGMLGIVLSMIIQSLISTAPFKASIQLWFAACVMPFLGYGLSYLFAFICKMDKRQRRTVGIETGMQNVAVALTVMAMSFKDAGPMVNMFPAIYAMAQSAFTVIVVPLAVSYQRVWSKYKLQIKLVPRDHCAEEKKMEAPEETKLKNGGVTQTIGDPNTAYRLISRKDSIECKPESHDVADLGESRV
ncbi:ileal sodium/bile acid cotransporter-like [Ptychodera flava]|uniref:ileal sodium/bile acid cotransporter-like n=1 Tax=Ptychodera flava TaxID=63121 RepID=UPI00396AAA14